VGVTRRSLGRPGSAGTEAKAEETRDISPEIGAVVSMVVFMGLSRVGEAVASFDPVVHPGGIAVPPLRYPSGIAVSGSATRVAP
jgi:hypothetical protein